MLRSDPNCGPCNEELVWLYVIRKWYACYHGSTIPPMTGLLLHSQVPEHAELSWLLGCSTPIGWLKRMTQWKVRRRRGLMCDVMCGVVWCDVV